MSEKVRRYTKHGMTGTKLHEVWKEMKRRCKGKYKKTKIYKDKGIKVCDEWLDAKPFLEWALNNGYKQGLQIDRIDNEKGYSPENCRWVSPKQNANNRSTTLTFIVNGKEKTLTQLSKMTGIKRHTLYTRIKRGWLIDEVITRKVR